MPEFLHTGCAFSGRISVGVTGARFAVDESISGRVAASGAHSKPNNATTRDNRVYRAWVSEGPNIPAACRKSRTSGVAFRLGPEFPAHGDPSRPFSPLSRTLIDDKGGSDTGQRAVLCPD